MEHARRPIRYLFLDIEAFTAEYRTTDDQVAIIERLNAVVHGALGEGGWTEENRILLPAGDGMCIALLNSDTHTPVILACNILRRIGSENDREPKSSKKFEVRVGLHYHEDTLVEDVNGKRSVAGAGINFASRVMTVADGNQILVSDMVWSLLKDSDVYRPLFVERSAIVKPGKFIAVHQLTSTVSSGKLELDCEEPTTVAKSRYTPLRVFLPMGRRSEEFDIVFKELWNATGSYIFKGETARIAATRLSTALHPQQRFRADVIIYDPCDEGLLRREAEQRIRIRKLPNNNSNVEKIKAERKREVVVTLLQLKRAISQGDSIRVFLQNELAYFRCELMDEGMLLAFYEDRDKLGGTCLYDKNSVPYRAMEHSLADFIKSSTPFLDRTRIMSDDELLGLVEWIGDVAELDRQIEERQTAFLTSAAG